MTDNQFLITTRKFSYLSLYKMSSFMSQVAHKRDNSAHKGEVSNDTRSLLNDTHRLRNEPNGSQKMTFL